MQNIYKHSALIYADLFQPITNQFVERHIVTREKTASDSTPNIDQWFFFYVNQPRDPVVLVQDSTKDAITLHPGVTRYIGVGLRHNPKHRWIHARWISPEQDPQQARLRSLWFQKTKRKQQYLPLDEHIQWRGTEQFAVPDHTWTSLDRHDWHTNHSQPNSLVKWAYRGTNSGSSFDQKQHTWCRQMLGETRYVIPWQGLNFTLNITGTGPQVVWPVRKRSLWSTLQDCFHRLWPHPPRPLDSAPY